MYLSNFFVLLGITDPVSTWYKETKILLDGRIFLDMKHERIISLIPPTCLAKITLCVGKRRFFFPTPLRWCGCKAGCLQSMYSHLGVFMH